MKKIILFIFVFGFAFNINAQCDSNLPISENFDDSNVVNVCWDLMDQDGDFNNWYWWEYSPTYGGYKCITSNSFYTSTGALTPDNWIISHSIDLSSFTTNDNITLSWKVRGELVGFSHENYSIYAATGNQISDFEASPVRRSEYVDLVGGEGQFVTRTLDISSLVGEIVYIAFRHHNSTNEYNINIDDVTVERSSTLGINNLEENSFKYFYHEKTDNFTLDSANYPIQAIQIYNIIGQSVLYKNINQKEETINLSTLVDGIYIMQVKFDSFEKTIKFIKR